MAADTENKTTADKVLDILLLFRAKEQYDSIEEISQLMDVPKSTMYRYIRILCDKGFLEKTRGGNYRLGLTFLELSRVALDSNRDVRLIALPGMKRIAEEVGESVSLMRLFNRRAICIENIEGKHALRVKIEQGRAQPLHAGASSKVLLAHLPQERWSDYLDFPLRRFTETTITAIDMLQTELQTIRRNGYGVSNGEIDAGARAVAVPLHNGRREVIAALSIEAPMSRMDDTKIEEYVRILRAEAQTIYKELS